jgi:hypothetical protein
VPTPNLHSLKNRVENVSEFILWGPYMGFLVNGLYGLPEKPLEGLLFPHAAFQNCYSMRVCGIGLRPATK